MQTCNSYNAKSIVIYLTLLLLLRLGKLNNASTEFFKFYHTYCVTMYVYLVLHTLVVRKFPHNNHFKYHDILIYVRSKSTRCEVFLT